MSDLAEESKSKIKLDVFCYHSKLVGRCGICYGKTLDLMPKLTLSGTLPETYQRHYKVRIGYT
jgi:hypothetical protein